ncbi:MAG TPA: DUF2116 family Zn-ribbon domain-containing protein [Thermoplasmatales archaeon]|nr:DUF2116 family Zn-ribbon domain-containing protein [Thermoplasmatales archaeon]
MSSNLIPPHTHCQVCGKAIPPDETFCSKECEKRFQSMVKKRKMLVYIMYGLIIVIMALFLLSRGGT